VPCINYAKSQYLNKTSASSRQIGSLLKSPEEKHHIRFIYAISYARKASLEKKQRITLCLHKSNQKAVFLVPQDPKKYKLKLFKSHFMKIDKLVVGLIVIVFAALLLANSIIFFVDQSSLVFSQEVANLLVAFVLVVLAASFFKEAKE
jgi:hypothetical protein